MLKRFLSGFRRCESGAVTVDWVVLTAALVMLPIAIGFIVGQNTADVSEGVGAHIENESTITYN